MKLAINILLLFFVHFVSKAQKIEDLYKYNMNLEQDSSKPLHFENLERLRFKVIDGVSNEYYHSISKSKERKILNNLFKRVTFENIDTLIIELRPQIKLDLAKFIERISSVKVLFFDIKSGYCYLKDNENIQLRLKELYVRSYQGKFDLAALDRIGVTTFYYEVTNLRRLVGENNSVKDLRVFCIRYVPQFILNLEMRYELKFISNHRWLKRLVLKRFNNIQTVDFEHMLYYFDNSYDIGWE